MCDIQSFISWAWKRPVHCAEQFLELKICASLQFRAIAAPTPARGFIHQSTKMRVALHASLANKCDNLRFVTAACAKMYGMNQSTVGRPASRKEKSKVLLQFWVTDATFLMRGLREGTSKLRFGCLSAADPEKYCTRSKCCSTKSPFLHDPLRPLFFFLRGDHYLVQILRSYFFFGRISNLVMAVANLEDFNAIDGAGWNPAHVAIRYDHIEAFRTLETINDSVGTQKLWGAANLPGCSAYLTGLKMGFEFDLLVRWPQFETVDFSIRPLERLQRCRQVWLDTSSSRLSICCKCDAIFRHSVALWESLNSCKLLHHWQSLKLFKQALVHAAADDDNDEEIDDDDDSTTTRLGKCSTKTRATNFTCFLYFTFFCLQICHFCLHAHDP